MTRFKLQRLARSCEEFWFHTVPSLIAGVMVF